MIYSFIEHHFIKKYSLNLVYQLEIRINNFTIWAHGPMAKSLPAW